MVPKGWTLLQVSDICKLQNGNSFKPHEWDTQGLPIIRIQNLNGSDNYNYFSGVPQDKWLVEPGQLLFSWAGTKGVSFGPFIWNGPKGVLNQHIYKVFANENVHGHWLYLALLHITQKIEAQAHGFKSTLLHVQKKDIDNQFVLTPPVAEQKKIAQILSTWDKAISVTEKLLANSQQQKKALMQQLLTGKKRLLDENGTRFSETWKLYALSKLFQRVTTKNNGKSNNVVTISGQHGLIKQEDFFKKTVASDTLDGYFLLKKGQFAYNKSYSNGYPMGAIKRLNRYPEGVVTTLYICFELTTPQKSCGDYWEHYFESGLLNNSLSQIAHEGGRAHGLLNVKPSDFFSLKVAVPGFEEQQKIASVLSAADTEISTLEKKLACLKDEKKALMQQLLTGKRRVKVDEAVAV
ncbi:TPA: restriction endonuclease subunit S [Enterobacter cloacae]|uniref:restriction endonuclease subunit S n=1 Tax=Enterobacter asburiae TaxID=61645 RepID=UPI002278A200|nr:restriction endonuclease subunit S [Enterobacter asburiae]MCN2045145.1 restriction endonuclease subunit S [Escherichia coli]HDC4513941.1 restriction endonuclease subunit S [Enterobacter cloacae]MCN6531255.1 restriction endonuclease subunit S [Escherichia coli]MCY1148239.1 restriction endonuclease subunit S [Enterobacter asburiae]HEB0909700.1 restriction endonuclease subunit S [Enterobacter cloacae]